MTTTVVERWTQEPLLRFVGQSSARLVIIMTPAGQVLAQGAAIMASSAALADLVGEVRFGALFHAGQRHGIHLAAVTTSRGPLVALTVFGRETSIGLVEFFFGEFAAALRAAAPAEPARGPVLAENFEAELGQSLASLFGR
jgi:hypothetical protein